MTVTVPNRPFARESLTGMMLPDGIFVTTLRGQDLGAHFTNTGQSELSDVEVYLEDISDSNAEFSSETHSVPTLGQDASRLLSWRVNFTNASQGIHRASFIIKHSSGKTRVIKKIFVLDVLHNASRNTFHASMPEYEIEVGLINSFEPENKECAYRGRDDNIFEATMEYPYDTSRINADCIPGFLPRQIRIVANPKPPFDGKHTDLPFKDPLWKIIGLIICAAVLIAGLIRAANEGGEVDTQADIGVEGEFDYPWEPCNPCRPTGGVAASGSTSDVWASILITAGGLGTAYMVGLLVAGSHFPDPIWRGQEETSPGSDELTVSEELNWSIGYPEPLAAGKRFNIESAWEYTRRTTGQTYTHSVEETRTNEHVLDRYEVRAPDEVNHATEDRFILESEFIKEDGTKHSGDELFVWCVLLGPDNQKYHRLLQDDGFDPDETQNDGVYTFKFDFWNESESPQGGWYYFVFAQEVNTADESMDQIEQAKHAGGMLMTDQVHIDVKNGGDCPIRADGYVEVN